MSAGPELFGEEKADEPKYVDKFRTCGRCRQEFWSDAGTKAARGFKIIPLFCDACDALNGADLRRRTEIFRAKIRSGELRWKKRFSQERPWEKAPPPPPAPTGEAETAALLFGVADDLLGAPKKRGKK